MNSYELLDLNSSRCSSESEKFRNDVLEIESSTEIDFFDYQQPIMTECAIHKNYQLQYFFRKG